jgi:hypothetical protein
MLNISAFTANSHNLPLHFVFTRYLGAPRLIKAMYKMPLATLYSLYSHRKEVNILNGYLILKLSSFITKLRLYLCYS